nr:MAG TPA: hypothetical protein [Caudoviricetes sp.]
MHLRYIFDDNQSFLIVRFPLPAPCKKDVISLRIDVLFFIMVTFLVTHR